MIAQRCFDDPPYAGQIYRPEQTLMTSPAMRQASPACLPSQLAVLHTTVPMQTGSFSGQAGLKGLQATSSRQLPEQIVPLSAGESRLTVQAKAGQTPELKQQL